jgi:putative phosphoesterase
MKKIGLLSDTHGYIDDRILHFFKDRDEIWHAGDWGSIEVSDKLSSVTKVRGVYGNIDGREIRLVYPESNRFVIEELDVWITHIGGYPGKYAINVREQLKANPPDLFICGHSHIIRIEKDQKLNLIYINPGAAGISGFHKVRTLVLFEINKSKLENMKVVELGARGELK